MHLLLREEHGYVHLRVNVGVLEADLVLSVL